MTQAAKLGPEMQLSEELITGIDEIDAQHRYFLGLVHAAQNLGWNSDAERAKALVLEIARYAQCHFAYEEAMMRVYEYPNREHHVAAHAETLKKLRAVTSGEQSSFAPVRLHLITWLSSHIPLDDVPLAKFVLANRP